MVQVDISQLSRECSTWREQLRGFRDEFNQDEARLRQAASRPLSKDQLQDVEHLHNQFHIQLINIHDLKQAIKTHERKLSFEMDSLHAVNDESLAEHENLLDEYETLQQTLQDLRTEFNQFLGRT